MSDDADNWREVLVNLPLYSTVRVGAWAFNSLMLSPPREITLRCDAWGCEKDQSWRIVASDSEESTTGDSVSFPIPDTESDVVLTYRCKNCPDKTPSRTAFAIHITPVSRGSGLYELVVTKFGQFPSAEELIPPELKRHFDVSRLSFYRRALRSRNFGYSLGALAYMRRVVEESMSDLLMLIAGRPSNSERLEEISEVARSRSFADKAKYAAEILPPHLVRDGQNPIERLHEWTSAGIHGMTEDECTVVFDKLRAVFEMLFINLENERQNDRRWRESMNDLVSRSPSAERGDVRREDPK